MVPPNEDPLEETRRGISKIWWIIIGLIVAAVIGGMTVLLNGGGQSGAGNPTTAPPPTATPENGNPADGTVEIMVQSRGNGSFGMEAGTSRCGPSCSRDNLRRFDVGYNNSNVVYVVAKGTLVTIHAYTDLPGSTMPPSPATFLGWGGDCSAAGTARTCSFRASSDARIVVPFTFWYCVYPGANAAQFQGRTFSNEPNGYCNPNTKVRPTGPISPPTAVDDSAVFDPARNKV